MRDRAPARSRCWPSPSGRAVHAPDSYMHKLVVPPPGAASVDIAAPVTENLGRSRGAKRAVTDMAVIVLDRPRHAELIGEIRAAGRPHPPDPRWRPHRRDGARGRRHGRPAYMGIGRGRRRASCGGGRALHRTTRMSRRSSSSTGKGDRERQPEVGRPRLRPGVPHGGGPGAREGASSSRRPASPTAPLLKAVRFFRDGIRTECLVMTTEPHQVRFIDTIHAEDQPGRRHPVLDRRPGGLELARCSPPGRRVRFVARTRDRLRQLGSFLCWGHTPRTPRSGQLTGDACAGRRRRWLMAARREASDRAISWSDGPASPVGGLRADPSIYA